MIPREIRSSPVKVTGSTPDDVQYESVLEEDFLFLVRFDPEVERYDRYRDKIVWLDPDGGEQSYGPDFEIAYRPRADGSRRRNRVVEVKPDMTPDPYDRRKNLPRRESPARNERKWRAAEKQLAMQGKEFVVLRSGDIQTDLLENAKFLLMYLDHPVPKRQAENLIEKIRDAGPMSIRSLLTSMNTDRQRRAELLPTLYWLIAKRQVTADLNRLLCYDTVLGLP